MATQSRVPGAASSEVDFALERFERTAEDRIEVSGRWFGLRGRRFVRPVLNLNAGGSRRRAIALLEHKPWAAEDGEIWLAAFRWPDGARDVSSAELEVGPGLHVELPALGGKSGGASVRVTALRPPVPALPPWRAGEPGNADEAPEPEVGGPSEAPHREPSGRAAAPEWTEAPRHTPPEWTDAGSPDRIAPSPRDRGAAPDRIAPPSRDRRAAPNRIAPPPRDIVTALTAEREEAIAARDEAERDRISALQDRDDALSRRDAAQRDVDRAMTERDEAIAERDRLAAEVERVTRERDIAHAERSRTLQDSEAIARERDQAAAERDAARSELSRALPARDEAIRERDAQSARADHAERERETAFAERKSAVAQRDRARRERDRAMRAAGVEPPAESPYVSPPAGAGTPAGEAAALSAADRSGEQPPGDRRLGAADAAPGAATASPFPGGAAADAEVVGGAGGTSAATPPGTPLPSRPVKRIGAASLRPAPEPKPLLTPVDAGRPRRLSRTRRPPSAPARWAVRITVILLLIAIAVVLVMLLARTL